MFDQMVRFFSMCHTNSHTNKNDILLQLKKMFVVKINSLRDENEIVFSSLWLRVLNNYEILPSNMTVKAEKVWRKNPEVR